MYRYFRFRLLCIARVVTTITIFWVTLCIAMLTSDTAWDNQNHSARYSGFFDAINHLPDSDGHPRTGYCYGVVVCFFIMVVEEAVVLAHYGTLMEMSDELASQQLLMKLGKADGVCGLSLTHATSCF